MKQRTVFPGLALRPPQSPIVLLIFSSGRIVCTGGRSYDDISVGFDKIYRVLKPFLHPPPPRGSPPKRPPEHRRRRATQEAPAGDPPRCQVSI